ncbi:hypothetical protein Sa4125_34500 [Aureimonas sp. SA4125]|uniref:hypothetical protein n=1 Tax=Aureimonas sp. SA4125 TaxID=2826993 RepID=UPI001CC5636A|nr:hypothetical protein [Aureimonas sp. SA4125]BDA85908.1 hypothetical protein Sa4125_34500 [Aureimonas sp. SA4125]
MTRENRREASRLRSRLRPGKLLSPTGRYLADCAIIDRSKAGARVRLFEAAELSPAMTLFDESETVQWDVRMIWSAEGQAGLRFTSDAQAVGPADAERIAGRYYALND